MSEFKLGNRNDASTVLGNDCQGKKWLEYLYAKNNFESKETPCVYTIGQNNGIARILLAGFFDVDRTGIKYQVYLQLEVRYRNKETKEPLVVILCKIRHGAKTKLVKNFWYEKFQPFMNGDDGKLVFQKVGGKPGKHESAFGKWVFSESASCLDIEEFFKKKLPVLKNAAEKVTL